MDILDNPTGISIGLVVVVFYYDVQKVTFTLNRQEMVKRIGNKYIQMCHKICKRTFPGAAASTGRNRLGMEENGWC